MKNYVYVLLCEDDSLYTGMTSDWKKRVNMHYNRLPGCAKYTRSRKIAGIAMLWETETKTAARRLEARFKLLKKEQKLKLISEPEKVAEFIPELEEYSFIPHPEAKLQDCI